MGGCSAPFLPLAFSSLARSPIFLRFTSTSTSCCCLLCLATFPGISIGCCTRSLAVATTRKGNKAAVSPWESSSRAPPTTTTRWTCRRKRRRRRRPPPRAQGSQRRPSSGRGARRRRGGAGPPPPPALRSACSRRGRATRGASRRSPARLAALAMDPPHRAGPPRPAGRSPPCSRLAAPAAPRRGPAWPRRRPRRRRFGSRRETTQICVLHHLPPKMGSPFASSVGPYVFAVEQAFCIWVP